MTKTQKIGSLLHGGLLSAVRFVSELLVDATLSAQVERFSLPLTSA